MKRPQISQSQWLLRDETELSLSLVILFLLIQFWRTTLLQCHLVRVYFFFFSGLYSNSCQHFEIEPSYTVYNHAIYSCFTSPDQPHHIKSESPIYTPVCECAVWIVGSVWRCADKGMVLTEVADPSQPLTSPRLGSQELPRQPKVFQFNPFHATGLFLYPLKTENQKFYVFRGYRKRQWHEIG